jgi:hypothetical protein
VIAWALTCLLHSTVLILFAWGLARTPWGRAPRTREALWKAALLGAFVTATLHEATGGSASLAPPIRMSESHAAGLTAPLESGVPLVAWCGAATEASQRWARLRGCRGGRGDGARSGRVTGQKESRCGEGRTKQSDRKSE